METLDKKTELPGVNDFAESFADHNGAIIGFGIVAALAHSAQVYGIMDGWGEIPRGVGQSLKHPFLGYLGSIFGYTLARSKSIAKQFWSVAVWSTTSNFSGEGGQFLLTPQSDESNIFAEHNRVETFKDLMFALAIGAGTFAVNERRIQKKHKKQQSSN